MTTHYLGTGGKKVPAKVFYDDAGDQLLFKYDVDCEPVIDACKEAQNNYRPHQDHLFRQVAEIPCIFIMKWMDEHGVNFYDKDGFEWVIKRIINDPDYKFLRTVPGKI